MPLLQRLSWLFLWLWPLAATAAPEPAPARRIELAQAAAPDQRASVTFIGAATLLIRFGGITILTDPNFAQQGETTSFGYGVSAKRLLGPALAFDQLPPVDAVLVSHMHDDHFDRKTQQMLARSMPVVANLRVATQLKDGGMLNTLGLRPWQRVDVVKGESSIAITSIPARHGPAWLSALLPEGMGAMLDMRDASGRSFRLYISGDTVVSEDTRAIARRFPGIDLAVLYLGGERLLGMGPASMDGQQGVQMLQLLNARRVLPVHVDDYAVYASPSGDFTSAINAARMADKVIYLRRGASHDLPLKITEGINGKP